MIDYYYEWVWHVISVDAIRFEGFVRAVPAVVIAVVVVVLLLLLHICYQLFRLLLRRRLQRQAIDEGNKIHHLLFFAPAARSVITFCIGTFIYVIYIQ